VELRPEKKLPEVLFVGRSNSGKSSLINALTINKKLAYISSKPGHTKLLNYYDVDDKFYLVDAPGYGFSLGSHLQRDTFGEMMEAYCKNKDLHLVIFLLDSRHHPSVEDMMFFDYLLDNKLKYIIVLTKTDKLSQSQKARVILRLNKSFQIEANERVIHASVKNSRSIDALRRAIAESI
jgi:GTP-binding protein